MIMSDLMLRLAQKVASVRYGTATDGDTVSLTDTKLPSVGQNANGVVWFLGGEPVGLSRTILSNPTDKFTFDVLLEAGSEFDVTAMAHTGAGKVVTLTAVNDLSVGDTVVVEGVNAGFTATNIDGTWVCTTGTNATTIKFSVTSTPTGTTPQTISVGTVKKALPVATGDRYAYVDKDTPRDLLFAAVNAGLRVVDPRLAEDITTLVDPEVTKYTLPTGVRNIIAVEVAAATTEPLHYSLQRHWREVNSELRFDYGYAPGLEDAIIRLTWREQHEDLTDDLDVIPTEVNQEALYWRSLIELLGMLLSLRPEKQRYNDLFQEAQVEWQRRAVLPPQREPRLAGW